MTNLSDWLTKQEAAAALGVSIRTVEQFAAEKKIQTGKRPQPGSRDATVYHPGDVERLRKERQPGAYVVPHNDIASSRSLAGTAETRAEGLLVLGEALRAHFAKPEPPRLFVSVKEASQITGLTQRYLRERIENGTLVPVQDGRRVRIRRKDLEGL